MLYHNNMARLIELSQNYCCPNLYIDFRIYQLGLKIDTCIRNFRISGILYILDLFQMQNKYVCIICLNQLEYC